MKRQEKSRIKNALKMHKYAHNDTTSNNNFE